MTASSLAAVSANVSEVRRVAVSVGAVSVVYWLAPVYTEAQEMLFEGDRRPLYRRTPTRRPRRCSSLSVPCPPSPSSCSTCWG